MLPHSDFNPKNILIDPSDCGIVGILDWEFAHAGSIHTDFGNFTRFERWRVDLETRARPCDDVAVGAGPSPRPARLALADVSR